MITKIDPAELKRRNDEVRAAKDEAINRSAVIYMVQWMKRRGVPQDKVNDLLEWTDAERREIKRIYAYRF